MHRKLKRLKMLRPPLLSLEQHKFGPLVKSHEIRKQRKYLHFYQLESNNNIKYTNYIFKSRNDLLCQKQCYNIPLSNNVMPAVKHNKFKNMCIFMDPHEQKKGTIFFFT